MDRAAALDLGVGDRDEHQRLVVALLHQQLGQLAVTAALRPAIFLPDDGADRRAAELRERVSRQIRGAILENPHLDAVDLPRHQHRLQRQLRSHSNLHAIMTSPNDVAHIGLIDLVDAKMNIAKPTAIDDLLGRRSRRPARTR